nr:hypothetical protein [Eubacterium sp.]
MKSVLGKLIQKEFGRNKYKMYCDKLEQKECMDIFCDIYFDLIKVSEEKRSAKLVHLLKTVQLSVKISQIFLYITVAYALAAIRLVTMSLTVEYKVCAIILLTSVYIYKFVEYIKNRYCTRDVRLVLIYKTALFHLLSDEGK